MRFLLVLVLIYSCSGTSSVPKGVLSQEKMEDVLYDVIRADEMVDFRQMTDSTYRSFSTRAALYDTVFQLHGIKKEIFQNSLKYYQGRPDLLKTMLDEMHKKITDTANGRKQNKTS